MAKREICFHGQLDSKQHARMLQLVTPAFLRQLGWWALGLLVLAAIPARDAIAADPVREGLRMLPLLLVVGVLLVGPRAAIRRQWTAGRFVGAEVQGAVVEDGIEWNSAFVKATLPWAGLNRYTQTPDMVLVHLAPGSVPFLYFPRSFFADDDSWSAFLAALESHLSRL